MENDKIVYPELSYKIVGCLFEVYNNTGYGHREKYYQYAVARELSFQKIGYIEQYKTDLKYKNEKVGNNFLDFLIEDKIILELKVGNCFSKRNLEQVLEYLKILDKKLAIIANFTRDGLKFYRVLNLRWSQAAYMYICKGFVICRK